MLRETNGSNSEIIDFYPPSVISLPSAGERYEVIVLDGEHTVLPDDHPGGMITYSVHHAKQSGGNIVLGGREKKKKYTPDRKLDWKPLCEKRGSRLYRATHGRGITSRTIFVKEVS